MWNHGPGKEIHLTEKQYHSRSNRTCSRSKTILSIILLEFLICRSISVFIKLIQLRRPRSNSSVSRTHPASHLLRFLTNTHIFAPEILNHQQFPKYHFLDNNSGLCTALSPLKVSISTLLTLQITIHPSTFTSGITFPNLSSALEKVASACSQFFPLLTV